MFTSALLRSALSVFSTAARQTAARQTVKVQVPTSTVSQYSKILFTRFASVTQWGLLLGTVMFWPQGVAEIVKIIGVNNV
ncbi:hypothetical protein WICPIJ_009725 [Wickerhamomyces pijperi]|uniref:Uncharacterized protein n=1 Tax=Wickerhamomyces pijperi TaxID=599730 RepID=A0A9P8TBP8_WICPI|nr:hypothetical protein WICPIJ_009725 [Wickerhamomyces pijperi]